MRYTTLLLAITISATLYSQDLHYHESGGFGTDGTYGINGTVYRVTNLKNDGEGSLRFGLDMNGPRLIVFEVGGIIDLEEQNLNIENGAVTIAGQTAPYPGITLIKGTLRAKADEVLIQHLTLRPGDGDYGEAMGWEPDGFAASSNKVVFDHCSVSWAVDENMSVARGGNEVTFYRCILAEGLSNSIHAKGEHSCGLLIAPDSKKISSIGSLYAHNFRRNPRLADGATVLFSNNVIYNYGIYAAHIGRNVGVSDPDNPGIADFIGNFYFKGADGWDDYILEIHKGDFDKINPPAVGKAYMEDNLGLDRLSGQSLIQHDEHITILSESTVKPEGFQSNDAYENVEWVLKHAGARPGERSEVDTRIVQSLLDGTGHIIDSQSEVGGYPEFDSAVQTINWIPSSAEDRRTWLDSISTSLEKDKTLDVSNLYQFIDKNLPTSIEKAPAFFWEAYYDQVSDHISLSFRLDQNERVHIQLVDMLGRNIFIKNNQLDSGTHLQQFNLGEYNLPDGIYVLILSNGVRTDSKKLMVGH